VSTWGAWKARHPDSLVLVKPPLNGAPYGPYFRNGHRVGLFWSRNRDKRLPAKELVFGVASPTEQVAIPLAELDGSVVVNTVAFDRPVVFFSPAGEQTVTAFLRSTDDRVLTFELAGDGETLEVRDVETGSLWAWDSGMCVEGVLGGRSLEPLAGTPVYWAVWVRHYPQTRILETAGSR
jgi:hypothetical protein